MYTRCPKCGHAPLPQDQASPAACPACGIILAKFAVRAAAAAAAQGDAASAGVPGAAATSRYTSVSYTHLTLPTILRV